MCPIKKAVTFRVKKAFTLIELLLVISIIGVLAGTMVTVISPDAQKEKARDALRRSNLERIVLAISSYYALEGTYPKDDTPADGRPDAITNYIQRWPDGVGEGGTYTYWVGTTDYGLTVANSRQNTLKYRSEWGAIRECEGTVLPENTDCVEVL